MHIVVEGQSDHEMARRVIEYAGGEITKIHHAKGREKLDQKLLNYCKAAVSVPWVIFRDSDGQCPVTLRQKLLDKIPQNPLFMLRIVHTMTEAWFLADSEGFASYFKVKKSQIPVAPEDIRQAKQHLLGLCLKSRNRDIRQEVARKDGHPGPLFVHHLNEFARTHWRIEAAAGTSPSLRRAITAIRALQGDTR